MNPYLEQEMLSFSLDDNSEEEEMSLSEEEMFETIKKEDNPVYPNFRIDIDRYPNIHPIQKLGNLGEMHIDDIANSNIDPEILNNVVTDIEKNLYVYQGFTDFLLRSYNTFIRKISYILFNMRGNIKGTNLEFYIDEIDWIPPTIMEYNGRNIIQVELTPDIARRKKLTYAAAFTGVINIRDKITGVLVENTTKNQLFSLPIMLGSELCYLHGKSGKDLLEMNECGNDPLGYFIVNGDEKLILIQARSRMNSMLMYVSKQKDQKSILVNNMTCGGLNGTSLVSVFLPLTGNKSLNVDVYYIFLGFIIAKEGINIYCLFSLLLGTRDSSKITEYILSAAPENCKQKIRNDLIVTMVSYERIPDAFNYIRSKCTKKLTNEEILERINKQLFPQMNENFYSDSLNYRKVILLSLMLIKISMFHIGEKTLDDRDSWAHKRLDPAGKSLENLFIREYRKRIAIAEDKTSKSTLIAQKNISETIRKMIFNNDFTNDIFESFKPGKWSTKSKAYKTMTDTVVRLNQQALLSHLTRISVPTSGKGKATKPRDVVMSQIGFVCPNESPEGQNCGLNLNLAVTAYVTSDNDSYIIYLRLYESEMIFGSRNKLNYNPLIINGVFIGWCDGQKTKDFLTVLKRNLSITQFTCIVFEDDILFIYCDSSRPMRPLLIVNPETHRLIIEEKNMYNASFHDLLANGCIEYVDPWEQQYLYISQSIKYLQDMRIKYSSILNNLNEKIAQRDKMIKYYETSGKEYISIPELDSEIKANKYMLEKQKKYLECTHCEVTPCAIWGIVAYLIPMSNKNSAVRTSYACNMSKQALCPFHGFRSARMDGTQKTLAYPQRSIFRTMMEDVIGLDAMPSGQNIVLAFSTFFGYNQEDSIVINKASVDRGLFRMTIYYCYSTTIELQKGYQEFLARPEIKNKKDEEKYAFIGANGLPYDWNHDYTQGECLIGKVRVSEDEFGHRIVDDVSVYIDIGEGGRIDNILVTNVDNKKLIIVKLRENREPEIGDKITSRYAQKTTIVRIVDAADMPFSDSGIIPDIMINPLCMPSRQTLGMLTELVTSKSAALIGDRVDATTFRDFDLSKFQQILQDYGFDRYGEEILMDGHTGIPFSGTIYVGPCYYQMLRHLIRDKFQVRGGTGMMSMITNAPVGGRRRKGGQKWGEMERDALIAHAAPEILLDRLFISSDKYTVPICRRCGWISYVDTIRNVMICPSCGTHEDFGRIEIPYVFKLLTQLLNGMGINISLRTVIKNDKILINFEDYEWEGEIEEIGELSPE